jgi:Domain of unknown function (DUF6894)
MPVYKFEITRGDGTESVNVECDSIDDMRVKALRVATDSIGDLQGDFWERPLWALRVADESNMTILSLKFSGD